LETKKALWNAQQNLLKNILLKPDRFGTAIKICLEQHAMVHASEMSQIKVATFEVNYEKD
jgi:hypothetical protein